MSEHTESVREIEDKIEDYLIDCRLNSWEPDSEKIANLVVSIPALMLLRSKTALDVVAEKMEAIARAEAAEAERDEWKQAASGRTVSCSNCETTEAEIVRLREALAQWQSVAPTHRGECQFLTSDLDGCTCGLDEARRMTRAALAAPDTEETR